MPSRGWELPKLKKTTLGGVVKPQQMKANLCITDCVEVWYFCLGVPPALVAQSTGPRSSGGVPESDFTRVNSVSLCACCQILDCCQQNIFNMFS